ncbi:unnamed protein product, partial [Ectocarpus sp. 4 AP-2014]
AAQLWPINRAFFSLLGTKGKNVARFARSAPHYNTRSRYIDVQSSTRTMTIYTWVKSACSWGTMPFLDSPRCYLPSGGAPTQQALSWSFVVSFEACNNATTFSGFRFVGHFFFPQQR